MACAKKEAAAACHREGFARGERGVCLLLHFGHGKSSVRDRRGASGQGFQRLDRASQSDGFELFLLYPAADVMKIL